ncbi:uncharacterized protein [Solanum lycopersicum]|uniref:uncharacterized protein n=1 Tax=Solanum lycopersicum TaxID=4081 RepID=UPI00374790BA
MAFNEANYCCLYVQTKIPKTLYEDNAACIAQLNGEYIKGDRTNHISPKFFFTHDLQQHGEVYVQQIRPSDNLEDLFNKVVLPPKRAAMLIGDMDISRLIVYVQQVEEDKLRDKDKYRNKKLKNGNDSGQQKGGSS